MKSAGIVVDDHKLEVFERRLTEGGFSYQKFRGFTLGTSVLKVEFTDDSYPGLRDLVKKAELECAERSF